MERPDLYVLARFLDKLYDNHLPMKKTNLQMRVGLNYPRFIEYLEWMVSHGLLVQQADEEGAPVYSLSSQGVDAHRRLVAWIRDTMKGMRIWLRPPGPAMDAARVAGLLYLMSGTTAFLGFYAPFILIIPGNATATAERILASQMLFRTGMVSELISAANHQVLQRMLSQRRH